MSSYVSLTANADSGSVEIPSMQVAGFTTEGVVHNDSSGVFLTSLIVNKDISNNTIENTKLAAISDSNVANKIVVRDGSGSFSAQVITMQNGVVLSDISLNRDLSVGRNVTITGTSVHTGNATFIGDASVNTNLSVGGTSLTTGNATFVGDASVNANLSVGGTSLTTGNATFIGDASVNTNLFVGGNTSVNANLSVGGTSRMTGNATFVGDASVNTNLSVGGTSRMTGNATFVGDASVNANLSVGGTSLTTGNATFIGDASVNTNLSVGGNASVNTNLSVGGTSLTTGNATFVGDASVNTNLSVGGTSRMTGVAIFNGDASLNANLLVSGNIVLSSANTRTITINGNTTFNSAPYMSGANITSTSVPDTALQTISTTGKVANSATSATTANTASTIVLRDASGFITTATQSAGSNNTFVATTAFVSTAISNLDTRLNATDISVNKILTPNPVQIGTDIIGASGNSFGASIATNADGTYVVVGAPNTNSARGAVRLYSVVNDSSWIQVGSDLSGEITANGQFGTAVAINDDGTIIAAGATFYASLANYVEVYSRSGSTFTLLGSRIGGSGPGAYFGWPIELSSDGYTMFSGSNSARVHIYNGSNWVQKGQSLGTARYISMSTDGNTIVCTDTSGNPNTALTSYTWNGSSWVQKGQTLSGNKVGCSVKMSGNGNVIVFFETNCVKVYKYVSTQWVQLGDAFLSPNSFTITSGPDVLSTKFSLNYEGNILGISQPWGQTSNTGVVKSYYWNETSWVQIGSNILGAANTYIGSGISSNYSGDRLFVSSYTGYAEAYGIDPQIRIINTNFLSTNTFTANGNVLLGSDRTDMVTMNGNVVVRGNASINGNLVAAGTILLKGQSAINTQWSSSASTTINTPIPDILILYQSTATTAITLTFPTASITYSGCKLMIRRAYAPSSGGTITSATSDIVPISGGTIGNAIMSATEVNAILICAPYTTASTYAWYIIYKV